LLSLRQAKNFLFQLSHKTLGCKTQPNLVARQSRFGGSKEPIAGNIDSTYEGENKP
jgi:hypothetical protein